MIINVWYMCLIQSLGKTTVNSILLTPYTILKPISPTVLTQTDEPHFLRQCTPKRRDHTPENQISETKKELKLKVSQTVCMIVEPTGNTKEDHRIVPAGKRPNIRRLNSLRKDTLNLVYSDYRTIYAISGPAAPQTTD